MQRSTGGKQKSGLWGSSCWELVSPVWCTLMDDVKVDPKTKKLLPESLQRFCEKWVSAACHSCRVQGALQ